MTVRNQEASVRWLMLAFTLPTGKASQRVEESARLSVDLQVLPARERGGPQSAFCGILVFAPIFDQRAVFHRGHAQNCLRPPVVRCVSKNPAPGAAVNEAPRFYVPGLHAKSC